MHSTEWLENDDKEISHRKRKRKKIGEENN